jgi:hypothetical protein
VKGEVNKWFLYLKKGGVRTASGEFPSVRELAREENIRPVIELIDEDAPE